MDISTNEAYLKYIPWKRTSMFKTDETTNTLYVASIKGEGVFKITGIGSFLWSYINGENSISFLIDRVMNVYDNCSYDLVYADVKRILDQMICRDLVVYNWDALA